MPYVRTVVQIQRKKKGKRVRAKKGGRGEREEWRKGRKEGRKIIHC